MLPAVTGSLVEWCAPPARPPPKGAPEARCSFHQFTVITAVWLFTADDWQVEVHTRIQ